VVAPLEADAQFPKHNPGYPYLDWRREGAMDGDSNSGNDKSGDLVAYENM